MAHHALKAPSNAISSVERGKFARGIKSVSLKIVEVIPELIARSGTKQEGQEIRDRALDFGVYTERAVLYLEEVMGIDPSGELRRGS